MQRARVSREGARASGRATARRYVYAESIAPEEDKEVARAKGLHSELLGRNGAARAPFSGHDGIRQRTLITMLRGSLLRATERG